MRSFRVSVALPCGGICSPPLPLPSLVSSPSRTDPGQQPRAIFERDDIQEQPRFLAAERGVLSAESSASHYLPGDALWTAIAEGGDADDDKQSFLGGRWMVTQSQGGSSSSQCRLSRAVRFDEPLEEEAACRLRGPIDRDWCTAMAAQRFSTFLRVAEHPAVSLSSAEGWVTVSLASARKVSFSTGEFNDISTAGLLGTDPDAAGRFDGSSCACSDAVVAAEYTVRTRGDNTVASVAASLVVADVEGCRDASIPLRTSVRFVPTDDAREAMERSVEGNNLVARDRAGQPGYRVGEDVVAGVVISSGADGEEAIGMFQDGLQVRLPNLDGSCPSTDAADPLARHMTVPFGESISVSCIETLDAGELENACDAGDSLPPFLLVNATRIGIFGNADPLQTGQVRRRSFNESMCISCLELWKSVMSIVCVFSLFFQRSGGSWSGMTLTRPLRLRAYDARVRASSLEFTSNSWPRMWVKWAIHSGRSSRLGYPLWKAPGRCLLHLRGGQRAVSSAALWYPTLSWRTVPWKNLCPPRRAWCGCHTTCSIRFKSMMEARGPMQLPL